MIQVLGPPFFVATHEVIAQDVLQAGTNQIEFRTWFGSGVLTIGDVVLHYERDIYAAIATCAGGDTVRRHR
jgi:hypothetical protein